MSRVAWLVIAAAISSGAASGQTAALARKSAAEQASPKPSVILITIDTLRADHVGCYGSQDVKTPTLDSLARDGTVFERAISQVPLTWPSHAVILTGTYPFQNGVQDFTGQPLGAQFRSVAQAFHDAGYATGAVVSAFVLDRSWGLARGFDFYDDAFSAQTFQKKDASLVDRPAGESVAHAIAWLKKTTRRPFFLWLHLYDPHSPYESPEPFHSEYSANPYNGAIAYADHELGSLIVWLKQNHLYDSSLIVVLSDHGESLGEHDEDEHGFFLYNATVRVPLIVKPPPTRNGISAGHRSAPVETAAVAPTLLEVAGVKDEIQKQFQTPSLAAGKDRETEPAYSETFYPFSSFGWSPLHSIESERYQFIEAPTPELYDLEKDPGETHNIAAEQPATVAVLREKLKARLAENPFGTVDRGKGNLSPEAQEKLQALGYFGFRAAVSPEALKAGLPDPKDKIGEFNAILKATDAYQAGRSDDGDALLAKVAERDPKIYVVPFMLGESALRRGDWGRAIEQLEHCLELNPSFDNAMTGLAYAFMKTGQSERARSWLEKAIRDNPENYRAWYEIGLLDAEKNPEAAQAAYEKAVAIQPNFIAGQRDLGMIFLQQRKYASATLHLEKAIRLGVNDASIHNYLGICYAQSGHLEKAVREHQRAIQIDPKLAEAHLNLGYDYEKLGNPKSAIAQYEEACKLSQAMCKVADSRKSSLGTH